MPRAASRWLALGLLGLGLEACFVPAVPQDAPPDGESDTPPPPSDCVPACTIGELRCEGDQAEQCMDIGCPSFRATWPCGAFGARCMDGACVFDEPCPADTDRLCRGSYLLSCEQGAITNYRYCPAEVPCTEVTLPNGRHAAACAAELDHSCTDTAPLVEECRGSTAIGCEYGIVIAHNACGPRGCTTESTPDGVKAYCN